MQFVTDVSAHIARAVAALNKKWKLRPGHAPIAMFELLAVALHRKAPMEFEAYLDVLREELPHGQRWNEARVSHHREEVADIVNLTSA